MGIVNKVKDTLWGNFDQTNIWWLTDLGKLSVDNAYKTRWIWYHTTILGIELLIVILIQLAILVVLAVKL